MGEGEPGGYREIAYPKLMYSHPRWRHIAILYMLDLIKRGKSFKDFVGVSVRQYMCCTFCM